MDRFSALPLTCGNDASPGLDEVEEWREWSHQDTTPDQRRIEDYLDTWDLTGLSILHVGIGNSQFAARFSLRARRIVGFTLSRLEAQQGERLGLPNYRPVVCNKYRRDAFKHLDRFDIVVDNNPSTFACCRRHFIDMMSSYARLIEPTGMLVTDRVGLGWVVSTPGAHPRWSFDFADWAAIGSLYGLHASAVDEYVYRLTPQPA
jgi:hypothetical protein